MSLEKDVAASRDRLRNGAPDGGASLPRFAAATATAALLLVATFGLALGHASAGGLLLSALAASALGVLAVVVGRTRRIRQLLEGADAIVWEADAPGLRFTFVSPRAHHLLGYPVSRWLAEPHFFANLVHPDDRESVLAFRRQAAGGRGENAFEYRAVTADGRTVWLHDAVHVARDADGRTRLRGVTVDVSERKRAERRLAVQHAVTAVLAEASTLGEATLRILRAVGECLGWRVGALWVVDREREVLRFVEIWHASGAAAARFEAASREQTFARGVGLPGRVWASRQAVWIPDVVRDENFPRAPVAASEDLHGAFGFPILLGTEVLGVIEFFSAQIRPPDEELLAMMAAVGSQIGQFIERKRAEEERNELLARERGARASAQAAEQRAAFLAEASSVLASSLDYETTLASLARLAVPHLADWCAVNVVVPGGAIRQLAVAHADRSKTEGGRQLERRYPISPEAPFGAGKVIRTGRAELVSDIPDSLLQALARDARHLERMRSLGASSYMVVPLAARGQTLGAIIFVAAESRRRFGASDLAFAEELARRAALAVDNARLYQEAQAANAAKDEFLAMLSHELRTPLSAIRTWVHLLRGGKLDEAKTERALETLERSAKAQAQLIDDLLDVSRITSGKLRIDFGWVDLGAVVEAAVDAARAGAEVKGIRLETAIDAGAGPVRGDADRLQQVVANLLSNAVKFTPAGGRVAVELRARGPQAEITVRDSGGGIDPAFLPHVFDRFRQADSRSTRAHSGLGLGLAIVRHLVELHGGTVSAESAGTGRGATFTVRLPIVPGAAAAAGSTYGAPASEATALAAAGHGVALDGLSILLVEDEEATRESVATMLEQNGARVTAAGSAAEALAALERGRPDVLVSDIGMPGEDGYALIERARAAPGWAEQPIPAIALTAYASADDRARALGAGYVLHLAKPVDAVELVSAVARLSGRGDRAPAPQRAAGSTVADRTG